MSKVYKIEKARSGEFVFKYKNIYLSSRYNPRIEADIFVNAKSKEVVVNGKVVLYGVGNGYHIDRLLKIKEIEEVIIFEYDEELLKLNKINKTFNFLDNRIRVFSSSMDNFYEEFSEALKNVADIIIHKPSLKILKDINLELFKILSFYEVEREEIQKQKKYLEENYEFNKKQNYYEIREVYNIFDKKKPFLIVAAGPSLDDDINYIYRNRDLFNIISVGTALKTLSNNNIDPDIIVIIDRKEAVKNQIDFYNNKKVPLCFLSTASKWAVESYKGKKYMFFNDEEIEGYIKTGKTVAVAATDIAIKAGANKIIFVGQDLAYLDNKTHTSTFESIYGDKDVIQERKDCREVKSVNGEVLKTTEGLLYFKKQLEYLINFNKNIKFYNISKGAYINGAKNITSQGLSKEINF
ncbi:MAG: motility associated factor glycosyltransferase family protein [Sarcina sp.]